MDESVDTFDNGNKCAIRHNFENCNVDNVPGVYMPVLFIPAAYLISWLIRRYGRGVQIQFSLLAVGLTARVIIITDLLTFRNLQMILLLFTNGASGLWNIGYRAVALILAFQNARVM